MLFNFILTEVLEVWYRFPILRIRKPALYIVEAPAVYPTQHPSPRTPRSQQAAQVGWTSLGPSCLRTGPSGYPTPLASDWFRDGRMRPMGARQGTRWRCNEFPLFFFLAQDAECEPSGNMAS